MEEQIIVKIINSNLVGSKKCEKYNNPFYMLHSFIPLESIDTNFAVSII